MTMMQPPAPPEWSPRGLDHQHDMDDVDEDAMGRAGHFAQRYFAVAVKTRFNGCQPVWSM
jgi:hypothetical protein